MDKTCIELFDINVESKKFGIKEKAIKFDKLIEESYDKIIILFCFLLKTCSLISVNSFLSIYQKD